MKHSPDFRQWQLLLAAGQRFTKAENSRTKKPSVPCAAASHLDSSALPGTAGSNGCCPGPSPRALGGPACLYWTGMVTPEPAQQTASFCGVLATGAAFHYPFVTTIHSIKQVKQNQKVMCFLRPQLCKTGYSLWWNTFRFDFQSHLPSPVQCVRGHFALLSEPEFRPLSAKAPQKSREGWEHYGRREKQPASPNPGSGTAGRVLSKVPR